MCEVTGLEANLNHNLFILERLHGVVDFLFSLFVISLKLTVH